MEAETYLSSGFGLRSAMEGKPRGWTRLSELAKVWMPNRLKGILVAREHGKPFLAATQVFDCRPTPRKFLAFGSRDAAAEYMVEEGAILVTRSGSVGRAILAHSPHSGVIVSDDLLRVSAKDPRNHGWLYAYLQTPEARAIAMSVRYGHMIKHLETSHLEALPVPAVDDDTAAVFSRGIERILALRNKSHRLSSDADQLFADALGPVETSESEAHFTVRASAMDKGRRRLEAAYHTPTAAAILLRQKRWDLLGDITTRVWWMSRFKRFFGETGIPYLSADELFTVNPPENKRILVNADDSHSDYFVEKGWIVMACSGQVYGLNGAAMLMTAHHENVFFSHDLIRIVADTSKVRPGYLLVALTHPTHGRPLLIREAYGTSIPHLDPGDVARFRVARLDDMTERRISELADAAAEARADADTAERELARDASSVIEKFIHTRAGLSVLEE